MSQANELQGIRPSKGKCFSGSNVIDLLSRWKYDRCLAAVATVLGFPSDPEPDCTAIKAKPRSGNNWTLVLTILLSWSE